MNYDEFKRYIKRLAGEYIVEGTSTPFHLWLLNLAVPVPKESPIKKEEQRWKPVKGEEYHFPSFDSPYKSYSYIWSDKAPDEMLYARGLVFRTRDEAIALAERMLEAIKN